MRNDFIRIDADYASLPWYRKRWFLVLTLLLFCPATIGIASTGDIYARRKDGVYKYGPSGKRALIIVACMFLVTGLLQAFR